MKLNLLGFLLLFISKVSIAVDILDVWQNSKSRNHEYIMHQFSKSIGEQRVKQSKALWLPNIYLYANLGKSNSTSNIKGASFSAPDIQTMENANFSTVIENGTISGFNLILNQPIYDAERLVATRQLQYTGAIDHISSRVAEQNLMLLVVDSYFAVLIANKSLQLLQQQENSMLNTVKEVEKLVNLGSMKVTDLQEVWQYLDDIKLKLIAAKNEVVTKKFQLADLYGPVANIKQLKADLGYENFIFTQTLQQCLDRIHTDNLQLQISKVKQNIAKQELQKHSLFGGTKLNAIASIIKNDLKSKKSSNIISNYSVGLQLSLPIFTGGYNSAKNEESVQLLGKVQAEHSNILLEIEQNIRSLWWRLAAAVDRVKVWEMNLANSNKRLDLTINGHRVGSRSTLERLQAQTDLINVEYGLYLEKIQFLLNHASMSAIQGQVNELELQLINSYLE